MAFFLWLAHPAEGALQQMIQAGFRLVHTVLPWLSWVYVYSVTTVESLESERGRNESVASRRPHILQLSSLALHGRLGASGPWCEI